MRRPLRLLLSILPACSLTVVATAAIGYHLLAQPARPVLAPAPPVSNPSPVAVAAGRWFTETEINGSITCMAIGRAIQTFPPMLAAPIATAVVATTSGSPPAAPGNPSGGGGSYYGGP